MKSIITCAILCMTMFALTSCSQSSKRVIKTEVSDLKVTDPKMLSLIDICPEDGFLSIEQKLYEQSLRIWGDIGINSYEYFEHGVMGTFTHTKRGYEVTYSITKDKFGSVVNFSVDEIIKL